MGFELPFRHAHFAEWSLALKGSRASGHLYGVATQINGTWDLSRLVFVSGNEKHRLDLTPVRPLRLPPAPHKNVYLVPIASLKANRSTGRRITTKQYLASM